MNDSLNKGETSRLITIKSPNNIQTIAIIDNIIIIILISKPQKSTQLSLHITAIYWRKFHFVVKYMHKDLENLATQNFKIH